MFKESFNIFQKRYEFLLQKSINKQGKQMHAFLQLFGNMKSDSYCLSTYYLLWQIRRWKAKRYIISFYLWSRIWAKPKPQIKIINITCDLLFVFLGKISWFITINILCKWGTEVHKIQWIAYSQRNYNHIINSK